MWARQCRSFATALLIAHVVVAQSVSAQRLSGRVRHVGGDEPVSAAVVWLGNGRDSSLRRVLTDSMGRFAMVRPVGATVAHVIRIGFRPRTVQLAPADTLLDVELTPLPPQLASIVTNENRVCPAAGGAPRALELWEQARAGLLADVVARETSPPRLRLIAFDRTLEAVSGRMTHHSRTTRELVADRSYVAARSPAAFAVYGYLDEVTDGRLLYAPDAETLLHPSFAEHHCFKALDADAAHPGQVGIAFEPAAQDLDTIVDVRGVLWIDRAKPGLRSLNFNYVGLEPAARESGGEVFFATLATGVQFVTRWSIRTALLTTEMSEAERKRLQPPRAARNNVRLSGIREVGGEVASARWADGGEWTSTIPHITGQIMDLDGLPVANALVWVVDSPDTVRSDAEGRFTLPSLPPGSYTVLAADSVLASAGIARTNNQHVLLGDGQNSDIRIAYHARTTVLEMMCKGQRYTPGQGVVLGRILDASGAPVPGARLELWRRLVSKNMELFREEISGEAGNDGRFIICGTPRNQLLRVRATVADATAETFIDGKADEVSVVMLTIRPKP